MHGRKRENLGPLHVVQLASDQAVQSRADGLASFVDEHASIVVELDDAAVWSLISLCRAHHDGVSNVSSPHLVRRTDGHAAAGAGLGTKVALLLNDYDDSVA